MNAQEFRIWYGFHIARFPSVDSWLKRIPKEKTTQDPSVLTRTQVIEAWQEILKDVSLDHAKAATRAMADGSLEIPRPWDRIPYAIRGHSKRIVRQNTKRTTLSPHKPICAICGDSGVVTVWDDNSVAAMKAGTFDDTTQKTWKDGSFEEVTRTVSVVKRGFWGVACNCGRGDHLLGTADRRAWTTRKYTPGVDVVCMGIEHQDSIDRLRALYGGGQKLKPAGEGTAREWEF